MSDVLSRLTTALVRSYRIERELGAGGMATVYLAEDLKHKRKVAIKVLKPELAAVIGAERFVVEIKTTAALQHPHILPLFDSGESEGFLWYAMPFIDGETLRGKLDRETQLGIDEAVRITRDVADALDYAHRHGVVHRDIKPENILLHDGRPMVADFGIALALSAAAGGRMTETGMSLGTPHYMSPEQATAEKEISGRSDVYSLASVLYEMLAGQPPHLGGSAQQIIMKIIAEQPAAVTTLRKSVPPNVAAALTKALEKLPADRFENAKAFAEALGNPAFTTAAMAGAPGAATSLKMFGRQVSWRVMMAVCALGGGLLASLVWALTRGASPPADAVVLRAELDVLTRSDSGVSLRDLDISPDGSMLAYVARGPGSVPQLYLRRLDDRTARVLPGTEDASYPAFSPDGSWIAFAQSTGRNRALRRIPVGGGVAETIVQGRDDDVFFMARWVADGYIYFTGRDGLSRVSAQGGTPSVLLSASNTGFPEPLPGGRHLLYTEIAGDAWAVRALDLETGETKPLELTATFVRYVPSGYLLLIRDDAIRAVSFDAKSLTVRGEPQSVLDSVAANGSVRSFALAANGTAMYAVGRPIVSQNGMGTELVDLAGNAERMPLPEAVNPRIWFSPDGRRVAFATGVPGLGNDGLSVSDLIVGTTVEIMRTPGYLNGVVWLPGGRALLVGVEDSIGQIVRASLDGSRKLDTLWRGSADQGARTPLSVTADGKRVLLQTQRELPSRNNDLGVSSLDSALGAPTDYLAANWDESAGRLSPDGRWVVYQSGEEAPASDPRQRKIYVRSFPEPGERYTVSDSAGRAPRWAPDGKTIYYLRGDAMVAASVTTTPAFRVTSRRDLFRRPMSRGYFDISPDGKRFAMPAPSATATTAPVQPARLVVVANWLEELRRKLGAQR